MGEPSRGAFQIALLALLITGILTASSALYLTEALRTPVEIQRQVVLASYTQEAGYHWTAHLKPNLVYQNKSQVADLTPLYMRVVETIELRLTYRFSSNPRGNTTLTYTLETNLRSPKPEGWSIPIMLNTSYQGEQVFEGGQAKLTLTIPLNPNAYWETIKNLEKETGTFSNEYHIEINPQITVEADLGGFEVSDSLNPRLTVKLQRRTDIGDVIVIENAAYTDSEQITTVETVTMEHVKTRRGYGILATALSLLGLAISSAQFVRTMPRKPEQPILKTLKPVQDLLVEVSPTQPVGGKQTTVEVSTLEDLAKLSEMLMKPILASKGERQATLYVIDGDAKYVYKVEAEAVKEEPGKEPEEERS